MHVKFIIRIAYQQSYKLQRHLHSKRPILVSNPNIFTIPPNSFISRQKYKLRLNIYVWMAFCIFNVDHCSHSKIVPNCRRRRNSRNPLEWRSDRRHWQSAQVDRFQHKCELNRLQIERRKMNCFSLILLPWKFAFQLEKNRWKRNCVHTVCHLDDELHWSLSWKYWRYKNLLQWIWIALFTPD